MDSRAMAATPNSSIANLAQRAKVWEMSVLQQERHNRWGVLSNDDAGSQGTKAEIALPHVDAGGCFKTSFECVEVLLSHARDSTATGESAATGKAPASFDTVQMLAGRVPCPWPWHRVG
jgi:hypothetical protein